MMADRETAHREALAEVLQAWNTAMAGWDAENLSKIYSDKALFLGSLPGLRQGREGVKDYFSSIPGRSVQFRFEEKKLVSLSDDCFVVSGKAVFEQDIEGADKRLERRLSLVIEKRAGQWLICLHHVSTIPDVSGEYHY
jgi:uncharacterized protein (TIGR02246 family)